MIVRSLWMMVGVVFAAGALGGVVNAIITDNGFLIPKRETSATGQTILRPGYFGNIFIGAVAALVSWGLYGPFSTYDIISSKELMKSTSTIGHMGLSVSALVGAVIVGVGGARWLSNEVDKNLLRAAAADAASKGPAHDAARRIATSTPTGALKLANKGVE